jgi:hypothetical protein
MYGEPRKIREVAERLERRADELRAEADGLHAASDTITWVSVAADRMREHARERRDELVQVSREYDEAALRAIVSAAIDRVKDAVGAVLDGIKDALSPGDEEDRRIAATPLPPPGHRDWLAMPDQVPGVVL